MEARPRHRAIGAGLAASAVLALLAGVTPVAAQDDAIPAGLPASAEESIAAAGRTQDASFCGTEPITLGIYDYISGNVQQWGPVMATAVLASIPAGVLLILAQRYIAAGALGGAIK